MAKTGAVRTRKRSDGDDGGDGGSMGSIPDSLTWSFSFRPFADGEISNIQFGSCKTKPDDVEVVPPRAEINPLLCFLEGRVHPGRIGRRGRALLSCKRGRADPILAIHEGREENDEEAARPAVEPYPEPMDG